MGMVAILGGVSLTLFGVRFLRKGLDRLFGTAVVRWISECSRNRFGAFGGGIVVGTVAPSSTGLAIIGAQLLEAEAGALNASAVLAILLGAGVGLTVTVQLLSFHVNALAGLLLALGVVGYQFCQREVLRGAGQCLLALGFVFLAMSMIGEGANGIAANVEIRELLSRLQGHAWLVLVAISGLTVLLQSSTATIALGLGLVSSGLLLPAAIVPWVLGTNLGLGFTSLLLGWSRLGSRRLGLGNVMAKLLVAVPLLLMPAVTQGWFASLPGSLLRQTAMGHTLFNLAVGLVALPLLSPLLWLATLMAPKPAGTALAVQEKFLDLRLLDTPSIALARATRETLRMADHVRVMLENFWQAFVTQDVELAKRIQRQDDVVDRMNLEIKDYLSRLGENRRSPDTQWRIALLTFSAELEAVGDLVDKHLCDGLIKQRLERVEMVDHDRRNAAAAHARALHSLDLATGVITSRNRLDAETLIREKHDFNEWGREVLREHYHRLTPASREQLASSSYFVDSFNALRRINSHVTTVAYSFLLPAGGEEQAERVV